MAPVLTELERLAIRVALEDLNTAFCYHLDHDDVDALLDLFADDVYYTHGSRVSRGRAELEQVFRGRSAAQKRTSAERVRRTDARGVAIEHLAAQGPGYARPPTRSRSPACHSLRFSSPRSYPRAIHKPVRSRSRRPASMRRKTR